MDKRVEHPAALRPCPLAHRVFPIGGGSSSDSHGSRTSPRAAASAWKDMMNGAEAAVKSLQQAFESARRQFEKK